MVKYIQYSGDVEELIKCTNIGSLLVKLEKSDENYYVGVENADLTGKGYTMINVFTKDSEGEYKYQFCRWV